MDPIQIAVASALAAVAASTFGLYTGFMCLGSAKRIRDAKIPMPIGMKLSAYFWLAVGGPSDVFFNWTRGAWRFRDRNVFRTTMFTHRIQYFIDTADDWRLEEALYWAKIANTIDPGHIHRVDEAEQRLWRVKLAQGLSPIEDKLRR